MSRKLFPVSILAGAVAIAVAGNDAFALGLGGLRVQSALNQPFVGEIDLLDVKPDELDTIKAQLASREEFQKANAERFHYLTKLRFSAQISPRGDTVIRVTSREPMREPYMDFLVETVWPKGRLVREYTVLLDPPVTASQRAPQVARPVASTRRPQPVEPPRERVAAPKPKPAAKPKPRTAVPPPPPTPVAYESGYPLRIGPVRPGQGLWRLAIRNKPAGATVAQTAMALYRNNQGAFIKGDINRLLVGKTLTIPSSAELLALNADAAQREFESALRGEKVRRAPIAPAPSAPAGDDARLKIAGTAPQRDSAPDPSTQATQAGQSEGGSELEQELLLVRETSESARQETVELRSRILELEDQLAEIQKLLQLRNAELARLQGSEAEEGEELPPSEPAPLPPEVEAAIAAVAPEAETETETEAPPSEPPVAATVAPSGVAQTAPSPPVSESMPETGAEVSESAQSATPAVAAEPTTAPATDAVVPQTQAPEASAPAAPEPRPRFAEVEPGEASGIAWMSYLLPAAGVLGLGAVGIGVAAWIRRRRRKAGEDGMLGEGELAEELPFGLPGAEDGALLAKDSQDLGQGPDAPSSSLVDMTRSEMETDEADVISEADIYIAYGRYREAEDLLKEEIKHSPDRLDLKFKLAEAYIGARKQADLTGLVEQMRAAGAEQASPEQWQRLMEMASRVIGRTSQASQDLPSGLSSSAAAVGATGIDGESKDVLSLDISDATQHPSLDLDSEKSEPEPAGEPEVDFAMPTSEPVQYRAQAQDMPLLDQTPPPSLASDLEDAGIGSSVLPTPMDLEIETDRLEPDLPDFPDRGADIGATSLTAAESEIDVGALPGASELNLDSLLDSRDAETTELDSLVAPESRQAPKVGGGASLRPVSTAVGGQTPVTDLPVTGIAAETPSSDLLSSQWQMDSGLWDETATKLDLARAYVEMGDSESARGILEEVVNEGNDEQRAEAKSLLGKIG